jgi:HD-GYP domain-containing protein (c-di-GMP phosphodiesterase class II)
MEEVDNGTMEKNKKTKIYNYKNYLVKKIVFHFLVFSFLLALMIMVGFRVSQTKRTEQLGSQIALAYSEKLDTWIDGRVMEIESIVKTAGHELNVNDKLGKGFTDVCEGKSGYFETLFITDIDGHANDCHNDVNQINDRQYYKDIIIGGKERAISEPIYSRASGKSVIVIAVKLVDEFGNARGLFGGTINIEEISDLLSEIKIEKIGEAAIVNSDGFLISASAEMTDYAVEHNFLNAFDPNFTEEIKIMTHGFLSVCNPYKNNRREIVFVNVLKNVPSWKLILFVSIDDLFSQIWFITILASLLLLIGAGILAFILRHSANRILAPLKETVDAVEKFDINNIKFELPETNIVELNLLKNSFDSMAKNLYNSIEEREKYSEELSAAYEELGTNNEELEKSFLQLEKLSTELEKIFETAAQLNHVTLKSEEEYLHYLLKILINIIDKAVYGSVSLYEDDSWNFVCAIGHDIDKLKKIKLRKSEQINLPRTVIVKNLLVEGSNSFDEQTKKKLIEASKPIGNTMMGELKIGNETIGTITIDSAKDSDEFSDEDIRIFEAFSNFASAFLGTKRLLNARSLYQEKLVLSIIKILEIHDPYTKGHSENVGIMAEKIASHHGLSVDKCNEIYWIGLVHDIGKILIPSTVLMKTGRLTLDEYDEIKRHPKWGAEILSTAKELDTMVQAVQYHHERWDGAGYPEGLEGDKIPLYSRIISVADTFDAMTSDRSYRSAMTFEDAVDEIKRNSGTQFDPEIVEAFIDMLENRKILV